jgi:hypothetical protein
MLLNKITSEFSREGITLEGFTITNASGSTGEGIYNLKATSI